ncbi:MAG: hypothetical protein HFI34_07165 [Lachnospiraceae bacterium]|nr:hypothetical protein [Lachnospiraceae bacterium]
MIADEILDVESGYEDSDYESTFDNWLVDQGELTPLLKRSTIMEESGLGFALGKEKNNKKSIRYLEGL